MNLNMGSSLTDTALSTPDERIDNELAGKDEEQHIEFHQSNNQIHYEFT